MTFYYNFIAVPLARQRVTRTGHLYNPTSNKLFRQRVYVETLNQLSGDFIPISGRVHVNIEFTKTTQTFYKRFGDIDNLIKAVLDAYNKLVWIDDSQVISIHAKKITGVTNHFKVEVIPLDEELTF